MQKDYTAKSSKDSDDRCILSMYFFTEPESCIARFCVREFISVALHFMC